MCLGIPGQIVEITNDEELTRSGKVRFGGIEKQINLAYVPEAGVGDYVIVHAGFAISKLDEAEAERVFELLDELEVTAELEPDSDPSGANSTTPAGDGA